MVLTIRLASRPCLGVRGVGLGLRPLFAPYLHSLAMYQGSECPSPSRGPELLLPASKHCSTMLANQSYHGSLLFPPLTAGLGMVPVNLGVGLLSASVSDRSLVVAALLGTLGGLGLLIMATSGAAFYFAGGITLFVGALSASLHAGGE